MSTGDPLAVQRGDYGRNLFPNLLFTVGRAITGPAQYYIITAHPLARFGIPPPPTGSPPISLLGHTFPKLPFFAALMPTVLSAKHIFWINVLCRERMTPSFALFGALSDFAYEAITSLVFTTASVHPMFSEQYFYIGTTITWRAWRSSSSQSSNAQRCVPGQGGKPGQDLHDGLLGDLATHQLCC